MQIKAAIVVSVLIFLCHYKISGQETYFTKTFTTDNGIPHNHVRSIAQDQQGFLWMATWDGLSRYDGYEFRSYYHNPNDTTSLIYFQTDQVLVDFQNNVWVQSGFGISKYIRETDNFRQFKDALCSMIGLDNSNKLWYSSSSGIHRWNYEKECFEKVNITLTEDYSKLQQIRPPDFNFDNENNLWLLIYNNGPFYFARCEITESGNFNAIPVGYLDTRKYFDESISAVNYLKIFKKDSAIWQIGNRGIYRFNYNQKQFLPVNNIPRIDDFAQFSIKEQNEIEKILLYYTPFMRHDFQKGERESYFTETFLVDKQKTVWQSITDVNSGALGLTKNVATPSYFKHHFFELNPEGRLNGIFPVTVDKFGTLWAGPSKINMFFREDKTGELTNIAQTDEQTWKTGYQPRAFLEDSNGIWIGYYQNVLLYYNFNTQQITSEIVKQSDSEDISLPGSFNHLFKVENDIYIFGYGGIYKYSIQNKEIKTHKILYGKENFTLHSVCKDKNNGWWVGLSYSCLKHYDDNFNETDSVVFGAGLFNIEDIIEGYDNDLWISLLGGGIVHFNKTDKSYRIYTTADGLSNNTCYGLLKDKKGNIWVSTNHGISRLNVKTGSIRKFGKEDGLKIDEFNSDNTYLAPDGEMYFAGMGGVVSFYPDSIDDESISGYIPPLLITGLKVEGNNRYFEKAVYDCDSVYLEKGDDNFNLTFACLDFVNAEKVRYRYRLLGVNDKFTETDSHNRSVNYSGLKPGKYRFEVQSANANGDWISKAEFVILIPSYFYQTFWFKLLLIILTLSLAGYMIYGYNRSLRLKARQQQDELKLESLRGQMNPHFIFNSLNSINYFISQNDRLSANRYIADFARLIRSILGNLSQEYIPLSKELESLNDYLQLEHLRFGNKFDYQVILDETISPDNLSVFPGMVQPFIENAIWHGVRSLEGRKGFIKIRFYSENPHTLSCSIEDDGVGRKLSELHKSKLPGKTSRGIGIVLERLKIVNHLRQTNFEVKIEDMFNDREETGTRVIVEIPARR